MNLQDALLHPGIPIWESCPATPGAGQYDSQDVDLTSQADFDSEDEYTDVTVHSG